MGKCCHHGSDFMCFFFRSASILQIMRTGIKSRFDFGLNRVVHLRCKGTGIAGNIFMFFYYLIETFPMVYYGISE